MAILRDLTKGAKVELCHYCDHWLFPRGKIISRHDKDARRQPDGSLKCGTCVAQDNAKLLSLFGGEQKND
jgi:hypothetical protein